MSLTKARELRQQRAQIAKDMSDLAERRSAWTAEDKTKFAKMDTDQAELLSQVTDIERAEAIAAEMRNAPPASRLGDHLRELSPERRKALTARFSNVNFDQVFDRYPEATVDGVLQKADRYARAYWNNMRSAHGETEAAKGLRSLSAEDRAILSDPEYRDMGTGGGNALTGTGGGYFVPVGFINDVEVAMKYYGPMLQAATIFDTATGQPLPYPTSDDTGQSGVQVDENVEVTTQDVAIGNIVFNAFKFSTKMVKVSIELLQDSAFDIERFLKDAFAIRMGRIINNKATLGVGTTTLKGIVVAAASSGVTVVGNDNASPPAPTVEVGYLDLIGLEHSVDPLYRQGSSFMFADGTLRFIKGLKDLFGRPLWLPGLAVNAPDTILGYPYWINNDMAALAASAKTVLFGNIKKYMIRRVKDLSVLRLNERFAEFGQVAFLGFARYDGNLLDAGTHPVKYLTQHA